MAFSWSYAGYMNEADDAARLAMARQHHAELSEQISATAAQGSSTFDTANLESAIARVEAYIDKMEARLGTDAQGSGSRASLANMGSRLLR